MTKLPESSIAGLSKTAAKGLLSGFLFFVGATLAELAWEEVREYTEDPGEQGATAEEKPPGTKN